MFPRDLSAALSVALALTGMATATSAPTPGSDEMKILSCDGPFAADSTEARLKEAFGPANVVFKEVPGPEGTTMNATVIYPNDPKHRLIVTWGDEEKRAKLSGVMLKADYDDVPDGGDVFAKPLLWQTADGLQIGSDVAAVEKANGKPFQIAGFGWDYGGYVMDWQGGKLDHPKDVAACVLSIRFDTTGPTPDRILGDGTQVSSSDKDVRAAKPRVSEISIGYAMPDAE